MNLTAREKLEEATAAISMAAMMLNSVAPTKPGYYWAQWRKAVPGTRDASELTPSEDWEPVQVFENALDDRHPEYLMVEVGGVERAQGLDCFAWGSALPAMPAHIDDVAVDRFAIAMKAKLAKKREEGRGGWDGPTCSAEILSIMLRKHVRKGDPVDVANLAMMLQQRGEGIV
jgi:hypothetical protein